MSALNLAIPEGSTILITGATGFVGSQTAKEFLQRGYKVRGTVRDIQKASWLVDDVLKPYADSGDLELVLVHDMAAENAFDDALKGIDAVVHIATIVSGDADPNTVVPQNVAGLTSILKAALKEPGVKEFVFTSSIVAAVTPMPGVNVHVERDTWNDAMVKIAWAPPPYDASRASPVYMASKVAAEKAFWSFLEKEKPQFNANVVAPGSILGEPLNRAHCEGMGAWMALMYHGNVEALSRLPELYVVDVKDVAVLLAAAVLDPEVKHARIQAWGSKATWNQMLGIMRKLYPDLSLIDDLPNIPRLGATTDQTQALSLLNKWKGSEEWTSLTDTVGENIKPMLQWYPKK